MNKPIPVKQNENLFLKNFHFQAENIDEILAEIDGAQMEGWYKW